MYGIYPMRMLILQILTCWKTIASLVNHSISAPYVKDWYQTVVLIGSYDTIWHVRKHSLDV
jgi:hypothetical protein